MSNQASTKSAEADRLSLVAEVAFEIMERAFTQAECRHPGIVSESFFVLASRKVMMHIVGQRLAEQITLPFTHLRTDRSASTNPSLTIHLWDERETGIPCRIGSKRDGLDLRPIFFRSPDGRFIIHQLQRSIICFDRKRECIIGCTLDAEELSLYERGRPLHMPLSVWHDDKDMPIIHAGLVSKNGRGVLFAGPAGVGKSTSALVCAHAGFSYLSDDLIGLETLTNGSFVSHSIYNSTFLEADHLERFSLLKPHAIKGRYPFEDKLMILLSQVPSFHLERTTTINAIALPRVVSGPFSRIRPASKGQALLALMPSFRVGHFSSKAGGFDKLAHLVKCLPCYWLEIGSNLSEIPCRMEELITQLV